MRELVLRRWCDECWHEGELQQEAVYTYTIGAVSGEARPALKVLELCETHNKLALDLIDLLKELGQIPDLTTGKKKPAPAPAPAPDSNYRHSTIACPVCATPVGRNTIVAHVWIHHRNESRPPMPKNCPECGEFFDSGTGMSAHRRSVHNYDALQDALSGVKGYKP